MLFYTIGAAPTMVDRTKNVGITSYWSMSSFVHNMDDRRKNFAELVDGDVTGALRQVPVRLFVF